MPEALFERLAPHADHPTLRRFLLQRAPTAEGALNILDLAEDMAERASLEAILRAGTG